MTQEEILSKRHSFWNILSFTFSTLGIGLMSSILRTYLLHFYETVILVEPIFLIIVNVVYVIWNAINDPLFGYISDKPKRFWKKWGKRFIWIVSSAIPLNICLIAVFFPPTQGNLGNSLWYLGSLVIFDSFLTIWTMNYDALLLEKFRSDKERTRVMGIKTIMLQIGFVLGIVIPSLTVDASQTSNNLNNYLIMTAISAVLSLTCLGLSIPGLKEDKEMIEFALNSSEGRPNLRDFFRTAAKGFKFKNFRVFLLAQVIGVMMDTMMFASVPYWSDYLVPSEYTFLGITFRGFEIQILVAVPYVLGVLALLPFWIWMAKKLGSVTSYKIAIAFYAISLFSLGFATTIELSMILMFVNGLASSLFGITFNPVRGAILDEMTLAHKKNDRATYLGIFNFFIILGTALVTVIILGVHMITGFIPEAEVALQPISAIWGIRAHLGFIPGILLGIVWIFFILRFELNKTKITEIQIKLAELKL
ncbi:MAG: MFS transporter [Candidatus Lokiarchaeota archaeon]|nr:MFS transporter [Candidatus Lokiarchaeota archaeon]